MLKKYVHTINRDSERQVSQALVQMNIGRGLSPCSLASTSGSVEYCHVFIVLCDSLQEMFHIVNAIFVRLHKATCRLFCWKTESVDVTKQLPDILKGKLSVIC